MRAPTGLHDEGPDRPSRWRPLQWGLSLAWSGFWVLAGVGSGLDPTSDNTLLTGLTIAAVFGVVPLVPLWAKWWKQGREARRARRAQRQLDEVRRAGDAARERLERLPQRLRDDWERLEQAHDLVRRFADDGWIEPTSVTEVEGLVARLERLLAADHETDRLGGAASAQLDAQVRELTELLVALADEAVEHQATLVSDVPVPATLAEARDRLAAARQAYEELSWPTGRPTADAGDQRRGARHEGESGRGRQYPSA